MFLGDSITQAGDYVVDVDCWLLSRGLRMETINLGLGSETATDLTAEENADHVRRHGFARPFLSERLERALAATKPDVLFACYGMNDSALPADNSGRQRFAEDPAAPRSNLKPSSPTTPSCNRAPTPPFRTDAWE